MQPFPTYQNYYPYGNSFGNFVGSPAYNNSNINPNINSNIISASQQTGGLVGKYVNADTDISANDVSMDGNYSIFPKRDMSEIYIRKWNANGTISTITYKPVESDSTTETVNSATDNQNALNETLSELNEGVSGIVERMDTLEENLERIEKVIKSKGRQPAKEVKEA